MARIAAFTGSALLLLAVLGVTMSITVEEFFPDLKGNLTKIQWAHKTNSQAELAAALNSTSVQMIEADVLMGTIGTANGSAIIPIMAHPPQNTSDLSLEDFLAKTIDNKKKGVKLDFKSIDAFEAGIPILKKANLTLVPIWLNADVLKGPVDADAEPVDAQRFLNGAKELPQAVLSLGWTTKLQEPVANVTNATYSDDQLNEMSRLLGSQANASQAVTYPVRACFAANDAGGFKKLLNDTSGRKATLTVWSSENDPVNASALASLIKSIGLDKVYLDVPESLRAKLNLSNSAFAGAHGSLGLLLLAVSAAFAGVFQHL